MTNEANYLLDGVSILPIDDTWKASATLDTLIYIV